jgi:hypothetical protein
MAAVDIVQCNTGTRNTYACMYTGIVIRTQQSEALYTRKNGRESTVVFYFQDFKLLPRAQV